MDKRLKIRPSIRNYGSQDNPELFITDNIPASSHGAHLYLRSVSLIGISTAAFVIDNSTFAINAVLPLEIILAKTKLKLVTILLDVKLIVLIDRLDLIIFLTIL
ncbi:hypothetical protein C2G38_2222547 [Gigaspora rosea]|uniref:Uncharacterized protein n=1 Tax=Gigaspora rosea TaxID=44941 RepID=A0A397U5P7_9GLOM|nr:hypothetical protein C2G38_2222547 [Gigaspora rosea]